MATIVTKQNKNKHISLLFVRVNKKSAAFESGVRLQMLKTIKVSAFAIRRVRLGDQQSSTITVSEVAADWHEL